MSEYTQPETIREEADFATIENVPGVRFKGVDGIEVEAVLKNHWSDLESYRYTLEDDEVSISSSRRIRLEVDSGPLRPGKYYFQVAVTIPDEGRYVSPKDGRKILINESKL